MAAVSGFTAGQNVALEGVEIGDIVLVYQPAPAYYDDASDSGSEDHNDGGDSSEDDGEDDAENENEDADGSSDHDDDDIANTSGQSSDAFSQATEDDQDTESAAESEDGLAPVQPALFAVCKIFTNESEEITDLSIVKLEYDSLPGTSGKIATYQLYGDRCEQCISADDLAAIASADKGFQVPSQLITDFEKPERLVLQAKPSGDLIRQLVHGRRCPAGCIHGFLATIDDLLGMVKDFTINTTLNHRPVCPSCMGTTLMREHQKLHENLEAFHQADFGELVEFYGRLNIRRTPMGYSLKQFDEREWGYLFDDMVSDEEGSEQGEQYEQWEEAMEPNNNVTPHPASKETIDSLPRKTFAEANNKDNNECTICQESFTEDQTVVELPCKHFFCDGGCIEQWLGQFASCPTCRAKLPRANGKENDDNSDEDDEYENNGITQIVRETIIESPDNTGSTLDAGHNTTDPVVGVLAHRSGPAVFVDMEVIHPLFNDEVSAMQDFLANSSTNDGTVVHENRTDCNLLATDEEDNAKTEDQSNTDEDTLMDGVAGAQISLLRESLSCSNATTQEDAVMRDKQ